MDDQAENAGRAALAMRDRLRRFIRDPVDHNWPKLHNGIDIHRGVVIAGHFGSPDRMQFTVIDATVNLAARIAAQTKPPQPPLPFTREAADELPPSVGVREAGDFQLKGISTAVKLHTLEASTGWRRRFAAPRPRDFPR